MFNPLLVVLIMLAYFGLLFFLAMWVEDRGSRRLAASPAVYALSLAVFATSWTYYGSVGKAVSSGMIFTAVYIGPTLAILLWPQILRRMVRIKNTYHVTSIADFISARYGRSPSLAALATCAALIGTTPYIALQIKSVAATFTAIAGDPGPASAWVHGQIGLLAAVLMAGFTIMVGVRRLDPTERHQGMVAVVAADSVIKLAAFLCCGLFITYGANNGFADLFARAADLGPQMDRILSLAGPDRAPYSSWSTYLLLSMSAIVLLPHQFHVAVIENGDERHIRTAMWVLPLYLLLISVFAVPIAFDGLLSGLSPADADTFVLSLPLLHGQPWLALFVYIGGLSAGMSMVMIASMTLSTMISNHLLLPAAGAVPALKFLRRHLLRLRWLGVILVIAAGYWFESMVGGSFILVNMGIISFAAILQFAPCILGGLFWEDASRAGAQMGLTGGVAVWFYTLVVPAFARSGWAFESLTDHGPFGIGLLKPEALLGLSAMDPLAQGVFWSLVVNIGLFTLGSGLFPPSGEDAAQGRGFVRVFERNHRRVGPTREADVDLSAKNGPIIRALAAYMAENEAEALYGECLRRAGIADRRIVTLGELADLLAEVENGLAGAVGAAEAHAAIESADVFTDKEEAGLSALYAGILADLRLTPAELKQRVDYHRERETLLASQAEILEERVRARTAQLEAANAELESFANSLSLGLREPLRDIKRYCKALAGSGAVLGNEGADNLEGLRRSAQDMDGHIDDILTLARLNHMEVKRRTVDLGELMLDAIMVIRESDPHTRVKIEIQPGLKTEADPRLAMLLVANLVTNAWKFSAGATEPRITFGKEEAEGKTWFVIRDNGAGFDMRDADRIFQPFSRLHGRDEFEGSGIGLTIVDRIIRKHGGEIRAEAEVGRGAAFRFIL